MKTRFIGMIAGLSASALFTHLSYASLTFHAAYTDHLDALDEMESPVTGTSHNGAAISNDVLGLDGSDQYVSYSGAIPLSGNQERTTSIWIKTLHTNGQSALAFGTNGQPGGKKWDLGLGADGKISLGVGVGRCTAPSSPAVNDGQWHLLTAVLPAAVPPNQSKLSDVKLYVDGVLYNDNTIVYGSDVVVDTNDLGVFRVGANGNGSPGQYVNGELSNAAIWNRAFTSTEVKALYELDQEAEFAPDVATVIFDAFNANPRPDSVAAGGRVWQRQDSGLGGNDGEVQTVDSNFTVNLGGGAGYLGERYNVLFISVDDLNDWVGCVGGNPQTKTSNIDSFAENYGMVMKKAYAPATVCNASRTAILSGLRPSTTGVYSNGADMENSPLISDGTKLPDYFKDHGYHTLGAGKIYHKGNRHYFEEYRTGPSIGTHEPTTASRTGMPNPDAQFYWGVTDVPFEQTKDYIFCKWGADKLLDETYDFHGKPFFMAIGVTKPHLPFVAPQSFYDLHPLCDIELPAINPNDLDDILNEWGNLTKDPHDWYLAADEENDPFSHEQAVQAYLAAVSYADACVGKLLDSLENSDYRDNTIVMIWGDHGWHLGEKLQYDKVTLWEESVRVPLIISVPGLIEGGEESDGVVNLLDLYPTLLDLCGLPANTEIEGRSFASLLRKPDQTWDTPTLTTQGRKCHTVTDGRYRYIKYRYNGIEELYDHDVDPNEWNNIVSDSNYDCVIDRLDDYLPTVNAQPIN